MGLYFCDNGFVAVGAIVVEVGASWDSLLDCMGVEMGHNELGFASLDHVACCPLHPTFVGGLRDKEWAKDA